MTTYIWDKNGKTIDSSIAKIPQFRHFRNAWVINGDVISEDLATAKTLFKDVKFFKPASSRNESKETYIHCKILKTL